MSPGRNQEIDLRAGAISIKSSVRAPDGVAKAISALGIFLPLIHAGKIAFFARAGWARYSHAPVS